jgi:hypothetical protein
MSIRVIAAASSGIALALALGSATAYADPVGSASDDEQNSYLVCAALDRDPPVNGSRAVLSNMHRQGLSDDDVVDGLAYAVLYTCPWYKYIPAEWLTSV